MSELTLFLIRIAYLAILWIFVLSAISVIRSDMFGARVPGGARPAAAARPGAQGRKQKAEAPRLRPPTSLVVEGANSGDRAELAEAPILIGRGNDAAIRLDDDYVSTRHARIAAVGDQWFVEDLGSTNGTYIGSARITQPTTLTLGTQVRDRQDHPGAAEVRAAADDVPTPATPRSPTSAGYARTTRTPATPAPGCSPSATASAARPAATSPRAPRSSSCASSTRSPTDDLLGQVAGALHRAHDRIGELVDEDPALNGTSTTATVALFDGAPARDRPRRRQPRLPLPRRRASASSPTTTRSCRASSTRAGSPRRRRGSTRTAT